MSTVKHRLNGNNFKFFLVLARGNQGQTFFVSHARVLCNSADPWIRWIYNVSQVNIITKLSSAQSSIIFTLRQISRWQMLILLMSKS